MCAWHLENLTGGFRGRIGSKTLTQVYMVKSEVYFDVLTEYLTDMRMLALRSHQQLVDEGLRTLGVKSTRRLSQYHAIHHTASSPLDCTPSARKLPSLPQPSATPRLPPPTSSTMSRERTRRSLPTLLPSHVSSVRLRRSMLQCHGIPGPSSRSLGEVHNTPSRSFNASPPPVTARVMVPAAREAGTEAKHVPHTASKRRMVPITNLPRGRPLGLVDQVVGRLVHPTQHLNQQHAMPLPPMPVVTITTFQPTSRMRNARCTCLAEESFTRG
jgi:hypothetical protein